MKLTSREITGIILWWAEGTKSRRDRRWKNARTYPIEVTNTDSEIIKIFLDFIRSDIKFDESRIHLQIQIHQGDNQAELEKYWSKLTKIPMDRFNKTIVRPVGNKVGKSKGTCKVRFADKKTYLVLEEMLNRVLREVSVRPDKPFTTFRDYEIPD